MTALENVMVGQHPRMRATLLGTILCNRATVSKEKRVATRARELEVVGSRGHEDQLAKNLSYGDQRRLDIARWR